MKIQAPPSKAQRPAVRPARVSRKASTDSGDIRAILASRGVQPALQVSSPGDAFEVEADRVAEQISAGRAAPMISRLPQSGLAQRAAAPEAEKKKKVTQRKPTTPEEKKPLQRKASPAEEKKKPVQRKAKPDEEKKPLQRKATDADEKKKPVQRDASPTLSSSDDVAERAIASKGLGRALEPATRARLEAGMGVDLGGVRVHDDAAARAAATSLGARAFTHGQDIWLGPGESQHDTRLMAHEATHVVQQQAGLAQRQIQRDPTDPPAAGAAANANELVIPTFRLPQVKARHLTLYQGWASARKLKRQASYTRDAPEQQDKWLAQQLPPSTVLDNLHINLTESVAKEIKINNKSVILPAEPADRIRRLKIPNWTRRGDPLSHQVDHIVELQTAGWPGVTEANELQNLELLDQRANGSAGSMTRNAIRDAVTESLRATTGREPTSAQVTSTLANKDVIFERVVVGDAGGVAEAGSSWWTAAEVLSYETLNGAQAIRNIGEVGSPTSFCLVSPTRSMVVAEFAHTADSFEVAAPAKKAQIAGLLIDHVTLEPGYAQIQGENKIATLSARWSLPPGVTPANPSVSLDVLRNSQYSGYIASLPALSAQQQGMSPVEFSPPEMEGQRIVASGQLHPTVPLFGERPIELRLVGSDIELGYTLDTGAISLPIPGLTIDDSSVFVFFGTRGLGVEGSLAFSVSQLGSGSLLAGFSSERGFEASGRFAFDQRLFDRATIDVSYRNGVFGAHGTIGIDDPQKIRGIRSAEITVGYDAGTFSAAGRVAPSIPGVQEAGLTIAYSEAEGLTIGGTLSLANSPGIRSGSLDVTLHKEGEDWKVSGHGTAQPAIPGVDSELTVAYDDGAFTASVSGGFRRGMLSGTANVGVTNRTLDENGAPTGEPSEEGALIVYGSGFATIQIAPWLQGTVGMVFAPNGEVTISGEIGLPGQLEIFSRKQIERSLLNIAVQIPIVPGIVAEVGGGLSAQAGIGPGVIDQLRIGITYNPAHEDQTHVTGDAHLSIPADAGARLAVRAGIGLGITGASATGGLEIGGLLGVQGAAEAGVHIDWTPTTGLQIDAVGELSAQPKFRFDVSGYVSVRALGFAVYDQRWELAAFEFGSDLRVGARFPIHYVEGQPFDISVDDVEFIVPDIDPHQVLSDLIARVA